MSKVAILHNLASSKFRLDDKIARGLEIQFKAIWIRSSRISSKNKEIVRKLNLYEIFLYVTEFDVLLNKLNKECLHIFHNWERSKMKFLYRVVLE